VTPPRLLRRPQPAYPPAARRLGREATVQLRILVSETGEAVEVGQTGAKAGLGFDRSAIDAAREALWSPATKEGVKVRMWIELSVQFAL